MFFEAFASFFSVLLRIFIWKILRSDLERELFIVLKENQILKRHKKRVELNRWDRNFYLSLLKGSKKLLYRLVIIRPETIVSWHRRLAGKKWVHEKLGGVGRPRVTTEIRKLAVEMKAATPSWGSQRIVGELQKLGLKTCKASVIAILRNAGFDPRGKPVLTWKGFVSGQGKRIFACDFFSVQTIFMKTLQVFFIIDIKTREIISYAVTPERNEAFLRNHLRSVFSLLEKSPDILISDRDLAYGKWMKPFLDDYFGIQLRQIPPYMPVFNCYAERMVRTFRSELTDRVIIYNERDLDRLFGEFVEYYNKRRPHASLELNAPKENFSTVMRSPTAMVKKQKVAGELITDFHLAA